MNIEIVGFYALERNDKKQKLTGTMHVYLIDYGIDLRGVYVDKMKERWFFMIPNRTGIDEETKQKVTYPVFTFTDNSKHKEMMKTIREKGKEYITKNILTNS